VSECAAGGSAAAVRELPNIQEKKPVAKKKTISATVATAKL
jgi:hypothetical protein